MSYSCSGAKIKKKQLTILEPSPFPPAQPCETKIISQSVLLRQSCTSGTLSRTFTSASLASRSLGDVAGIFFKAVSSLDRLLSIGEESLPLPTPLTSLASPFMMASSSAELSRVGRPGPDGPAPLNGPSVRLLRVGSLMPPGKSAASVPQMEGSQGNALLT